MLDILRSLRIAARSLGRRPVFAASALATLALGIGGNVAVFAVVDRILVRPLPFRDPGRLVRIVDTVPAAAGKIYRSQVLPWHLMGLRDRLRSSSFEATAAIRPERITWIGREGAASFQGARVSAGALEVLGVRPALGRSFTGQEIARGEASDAALVSARLWRSRLGGRADALGTRIALGDGNATVVGVLPDGFRYPYSSDVWRPMAVEASDPRDLLVVSRLAPGATLARANAELASIARSQESDGPPVIRGRGMEARSLADDLLEDRQTIPIALLAAMGSLLLLASVNLAALVLARSVARMRESAVRAALGATRAAQVVHGLCETVLLAAAGAVLGLVIARAASGPLTTLLPRAFSEDLPVPSAAVASDAALFAIGLALATGVLAGIVPAWRSAHADPALALAEVGRSGTSGRATARWLGGFVVAEVALSTVLVAGGGSAVAAFLEERRRPTGLVERGLYSMEVPLLDASEGSPERARILVDETLRRLSAVPGVEAAAAVSANPFSDRRWGVRVAPERAADAERSLSTVNLRLVSPGLFRAWGTPLVAGRDVRDADGPESAAVAIVSARLARRWWPGVGGEAIGRRIWRRAPGGELVPMTVVGVTADVRDSGDLDETIYLPFAQTASLEAGRAVYLMVRGQPDGAWPREAVRALGRVDPRLGVAEAGFMDVLFAGSIAQEETAAAIAVFLGGFGLLLAATGILGTVGFAAARRRGELGIRYALGATPEDLRRLLLRDGLRLALTGGLVGIPAALTINRILASALPSFGERPVLTLALAASILAVAALCCDLPARRAARAARTMRLPA